MKTLKVIDSPQSKAKYKRYFRIISNPETPNKKRNQERTPEKETEDLVRKKRKYVYIDINECIGFNKRYRIWSKSHGKDRPIEIDHRCGK